MNGSVFPSFTPVELKHPLKYVLLRRHHKLASVSVLCSCPTCRLSSTTCFIHNHLLLLHSTLITLSLSRPLFLPCPLLDVDICRCVQIACGRKHILALMEGGYVFSWGTGYLGQLGLGDDSSWDSPRMIKNLDPAKMGAVTISL